MEARSKSKLQVTGKQVLLHDACGGASKERQTPTGLIDAGAASQLMQAGGWLPFPLFIHPP